MTLMHLEGGIGVKFREKPVEVQAVQFTREMAEGNEPLPIGVIFCRRELDSSRRFPEHMMAYANHEIESLRDLAHYDHYHRHIIRVIGGVEEVKIGDWLISSRTKGIFICKPGIFEATYEPAE